MRAIGIRNVGEGVGIAFDALRANKLRSALTILGVVIGVTTVMAIASMVQGIRTQIFNAIETAGPSVFYVVRFFSQTPLNPDRLPYEVRIRPIVSSTDAAGDRAPAPRSRTPGCGCSCSSAWSIRANRTQTHHRVRRRRTLHGHPGRHPAPGPVLHAAAS